MDADEKTPELVRGLERLQLMLEQHMLKFDKFADEQGEFRNHIYAVLYGTPDKGVPGIVIKLDRLEQSHSRSSRLIWIVISVVCAALAGMLLGK